MPTSPPSVTALPTPPSRDDPANFPTRGDTFLAALPTFQAQHQALAANAYANALEAEADATAADASALSASNAASASAASAITAASGSGAPLWVSGTTYAALARVISPLSLLIYRRVSAGAGTLDPSIDSANWRLAAPFQLQLIRVTGTTVTASAGGRYALENAAPSTLTLPVSASTGDLIEVAVANQRRDNVLDRNGHKIMGVDEDVTLNVSNASISLEYVSASFGWRLYALGTAGGPLATVSQSEVDSLRAVQALVSQGGNLAGWQDFATAADGSPTLTDNDLPWALTVGSGHGANAAMRVVSGKLTNTATDAATRAGYAEFDAGGPISRIGCRFTLGPGATDDGSATVVAWAESIAASFDRGDGVPDTPLHLSIRATTYRLSYWLDGEETVLVNSLAFATPLVNDGATEYQVEMARDGGHWALLLPDGTAVSGYSAAIANIPARWACFENFQTNASTATRAAFSRVWTRTAPAGADKYIKAPEDRAAALAYSRAVALAENARRVASVEYAPASANDKALTTTNAEVDTTNLRTSFTFGTSGVAIVEISGVCIHSGGSLFLSAFINGASSGQVVVAKRNATTSGSGEEFSGRVRITGTVGATVNVGVGAYVTAGSGTMRAHGPSGHRICMTVTPT